MPEQRRKRYKRRQVGMAIGRHTQIGAGRPVKHPRRNLQQTQRLGTAQIAAENNAVRLLNRLVNADPKTKPRMPWIKQFPKLGAVGVLKLCCTTPFARILASAGWRQPFMLPNSHRNGAKAGSSMALRLGPLLCLCMM